MKKLLILGFTKLAYMPYMNFYIEALHDTDAEIHVVSWRRDQEPDINLDDKHIVVHAFSCNQADEVAKVTKVTNFLRYRSYVCALMKQTRFDRIIVLHTLPAVLVADVLLRKYRGKFILDYRDYTYEGFSPFKWLVGKLVKASYASFVSSDAFRENLPKVDKLYTSHNLLTDSLKHRDVRSSLPKEHSPLRIAFWGFIRHERINSEIIRKLGNDSRFELHYYGREQQTAENMKKLILQNGYNNIFFHGTYKPQDRYAFAAQTDIIHNMYENDAGTQRAMGNKYYDGIVFRIPQLCNVDSYMGQRVQGEHTGWTLDPFAADFADRVFTCYSDMDRQAFHHACDQATQRITNEYEAGRMVVAQMMKG